MVQKKIIIIGPAHPLRGGLASFNERLAKQFLIEKHDINLYTFSLQYPNFIFPGTSQYTTVDAPKDLIINVCINSINPINWIRIGLKIKKIKPDIIIVRYWLPFMAPCLGTILRIIKKNKHSKIVCIADNILPHEKRIGDKILSKYFVRSVDEFIVMSEQVQTDLQNIFKRQALKIAHPLYDNFGEKINKQTARQFLKLEQGEQKIILFFGFIRKYKGLDLLLEAMANPTIKEQKIKLLIAGEFYDNKETYLQLINTLGLQNNVVLQTNFIQDNEVKYFLSACDFVIQPYKSATQSGVTPLAYHFEKPILVTNVGALAIMVPHEKVGLVCEPNSAEIASGILKLYQMGEAFFIKNIIEEKTKYSWNHLTNAILKAGK